MLPQQVRAHYYTYQFRFLRGRRWLLFAGARLIKATGGFCTAEYARVGYRLIPAFKRETREGIKMLPRHLWKE